MTSCRVRCACGGRTFSDVLPVEVGGPMRYVPQQFDFPHLWFTSLSTSRKEMWKGSVEGADGAALVFWWNMKHTDFVRKHPTLKPEGWSDTIPIAQHRDAGAFSKNDSLMSKMFPCTCIKQSELVPGTIEAIMELLFYLSAFIGARDGRKHVTHKRGPRTLGSAKFAGTGSLIASRSASSTGRRREESACFAVPQELQGHCGSRCATMEQHGGLRGGPVEPCTQLAATGRAHSIRRTTDDRAPFDVGPLAQV